MGTIEQINVSPVKKYQFVIGKLLPFWFIALFELGFGLTLARIIFGIPILGSLWLIFGVASVYLLAVLGIGLFISTMAKTQQEAQMLGMLIQLPSLFLAGIFFPIAAMPPFLQFLSRFIPLRYFNEIVRAIMLKGATFQDVRSQEFALVIFAVVIMGAAMLRFRKRLD